MKFESVRGWMPLFATFSAFMFACAKSGEDGSVTMSEIATATVSGAVHFKSGTERARWMPSLIATAYAGNSCPTPETGVDAMNCAVDATGKVLTLSYSSCNFGNNSSVWDGTEVLESSQALSCGQAVPETAGTTLLRTFGPETTRTIGNSVHVASLDTTNPSGYESPTSGGTFVTYKADGGRTIDIKGVHILSQKIFRGNGNDGRVETEADHTVSTGVDQPLDVNLGTSGVRVVNGTLKVQHNLAKYTGTAVFKDVTYSSSSGCCLPQSGTITTTLSGSRNGTETLTFSGSDCGSAKMEDEKGGASDVILTRCF